MCLHTCPPAACDVMTKVMTCMVDNACGHRRPRHWMFQYTRLSTVGDRAFPVATARTWNSLPAEVSSSNSLQTFKIKLKSRLFWCPFHGFLTENFKVSYKVTEVLRHFHSKFNLCVREVTHTDMHTETQLEMQTDYDKQDEGGRNRKLTCRIFLFRNPKVYTLFPSPLYISSRVSVSLCRSSYDNLYFLVQYGSTRQNGKEQ